MASNFILGVGTVISGTMRPEDLIPAFADVLRDYDAAQDVPRFSEIVEIADAIICLYNNGWKNIMENESTGYYFLNETLFDSMNEIASSYYCHFGAHEGDGSDYGFWPNMEEIEELPKVSDPNKIPEGGTGEDCVYVNDHGNVTVYGADGKVILQLV